MNKGYIFAVVCALMALCGGYASAKSSKWGDNIQWELVEDTLKIRGFGAIQDMEMYKPKAWRKPEVWKQVKVIEMLPGITEIGADCFYNLEDADKTNPNAVTVFFPYGLKSIGGNAFKNLNLNPIDLPSCIEKISFGAFAYPDNKDCEPWETLFIPASIKKISDVSPVFGGRIVSNLVFLGPTSIGQNLITSIRDLRSIDFDNQAVSIGGKTFGSYDSIRSIRNFRNVQGLPYDLKNKFVFNRAPKEIEIDGYTYRLNYSDMSALLMEAPSEGDIDILNQVSDEGEIYSVTDIRDGLFKGNTSITSIVFPADMRVIGEKMCQGCTALSHVELPANLIRIKEFAFEGCTALETIDIPSGTKILEDACFSGCTALRYVHLPDSIRKIGEYCFDNCPQLKSIDVPEGVEFGHDWYRNRYN